MEIDSNSDNNGVIGVALGKNNLDRRLQRGEQYREVKKTPSTSWRVQRSYLTIIPPRRERLLHFVRSDASLT